MQTHRVSEYGGIENQFFLIEANLNTAHNEYNKCCTGTACALHNIKGLYIQLAAEFLTTFIKIMFLA